MNLISRANSTRRGTWFSRGVLAAAVAGLAIAGLPAAAAGAAHRVAGGGTHGMDFTGDGLPDVLARDRDTGALKVYPHSGSYDGLNTYPSVVTVNRGWQGMRWIGAADLTGDGFADVIAIDQNWRMVVARHSGVFDGERTLLPGLTVVGYNWHVNDLVAVGSDGGTLVARRGDTGKLYKYQHNGLNGLDTYYPPAVFDPRGDGLGQPDAVAMGMSPVRRGGDGPSDFVYTNPAGELHAIDPYFHWDGVYGYGWHTVDSIVFTDLDQSYHSDVLARDKATGNLVAYLGVEGGFTGPFVVGHHWQTNDIIT